MTDNARMSLSLFPALQVYSLFTAWWTGPHVHFQLRHQVGFKKMNLKG